MTSGLISYETHQVQSLGVLKGYNSIIVGQNLALLQGMRHCSGHLYEIKARDKFCLHMASVKL